MLYIRKDSILYLYQLGFDTKKTAFLVTMRRAIFEEMTIEYMTKYIDAFIDTKEFGGNSFAMGDNKKFGFLSCGEIVYEDDEKVIISFEVDGRGNNKLKLKSIALIKTLSCIFSITKSFISHELTINSPELEQQVFIELTHAKSFIYGFSIGAELSSNFSRWIRHGEDYEDGVNKLVATNCLKVFKKLTSRDGIVSGKLGLGEKGFLFSGLHGVYSSQFGTARQDVLDYDESHSFGYGTFCHNTDTVVDQLVHLAGFATLLGCAREMQGQINIKSPHN